MLDRFIVVYIPCKVLCKCFALPAFYYQAVTRDCKIVIFLNTGPTHSPYCPVYSVLYHTFSCGAFIHLSSSTNLNLFIAMQECQNEANGGKFRLRDLLSVPMQRVLKYPLLLRVILLRYYIHCVSEKTAPVRQIGIYTSK